jgi:hypothetical protein
VHWKVLVDAAKLAGSAPLDLSRPSVSGRAPDLVVVSFYKMFGYPTGLGALLVRRNGRGSQDREGDQVDEGDDDVSGSDDDEDDDEDDDDEDDDDAEDAEDDDQDTGRARNRVADAERAVVAARARSEGGGGKAAGMEGQTTQPAQAEAGCRRVLLGSSPRSLVPAPWRGSPLVRERRLGVLRKREGHFFGGGAVAFLSPTTLFYERAQDVAAFEEGTVSFAAVAALDAGFQTLTRVAHAHELDAAAAAAGVGEERQRHGSGARDDDCSPVGSEESECGKQRGAGGATIGGAAAAAAEREWWRADVAQRTMRRISAHTAALRTKLVAALRAGGQRGWGQGQGQGQSEGAAEGKSGSGSSGSGAGAETLSPARRLRLLPRVRIYERSTVPLAARRCGQGATVAFNVECGCGCGRLASPALVQRVLDAFDVQVRWVRSSQPPGPADPTFGSCFSFFAAFLLG